MKIITHYHEDKSEGQYSAVSDDDMIPFLEKLITLADTPHFKIYYRVYRNYREDCDTSYVYGIMPELKHDVTLANSCGDGYRRIWLQHRFQKDINEGVGSLTVISPRQIEVFDRLFAKWKAVGTNVQHSDAAVAEEIMQLGE